VTPDGKRAVSGSRDHTCILWDLESGQALKTLKKPFSLNEIYWASKIDQGFDTFAGHTSTVTAVSVTPDGKHAVSGSDEWDKTCIIWDLETGQAFKTLIGHTDKVNTLSITPDGKRAVSSSSDKTCILWNLESGQMIARFVEAVPIIAAALFSKGIFVGGENGLTAILHVSREILYPDLGFVTVRNIWEFEKHQYLGPYVDCPFCGNRFEPQKAMLDTIRGILRNSGIGPHDSPCLSLPKEAWEEPGLLSECPKCHEAIKFNPFIVEKD
jgi:WD40 repeat protein